MPFGTEPSSSDSDLTPKTVIDRYRVEGLLGRGGMASVYTVRHLQLGSLHALKIVDTTNQQLCSRLLQEGRVQARLSHANVVRITDVVRVEGRPGLVLEYVAGPTLAEVLRDLRLTPAQVDHLALGILRGVEVAHGLGFAHRDLKPGNILIARSPEGPVPKVADFGLAKVLEGQGLDTTRPNMAMGTPSYMAPEQIQDARSADAISDVFSLGAILFEMMTGQKCFPGNTVFEIFRKIGAGEHPSLAELAPGFPARMVRTVEAALRVDRADRAAGVRQLRELWTADGWTPSFVDPFGTALDALFEERTPQLEPFTPLPEHVTPAPAERAPAGWEVAGDTVIPDDGPSAEPTGGGSSSSSEHRASAALPPGEARRIAEDATTLPPPVIEAAPPPDARGSSRRLLAGFATLVGAVALVGVGWVVGSGHPTSPEPAPVVVPVAAPAPALAPDPAPAPAPEVAPAPPSPAAPEPAPVAPSQVRRRSPAPAPAPASTAAVRPVAPEPAPPLEPPPEPARAPEPPSRGHVAVSGDLEHLFFTPAGSTQVLRERDLPPGRYTALARFGDGDPSKLCDFTVKAGETSTLQCNSRLRICRCSPP